MDTLQGFLPPYARAGVFIVTSLSQKQVKDFIQKHGVAALFASWQAYNQYYEGRASRQKEQAFKQEEQASKQKEQTSKQEEQTFKVMEESIPKLLNHVESVEIRVIPGAFNSSPPYLATFQTAALIAITLAILELSSAIKRVGSKLEAIQNELAISNVAKIQGWEGEGFGAHVHRFVRNEMRLVAHERNNENPEYHCFYVWNPDTDWYPVFEQKNGESPLGPDFGGYHHDLAAICLRMQSDRVTLTKTTSYGNTAKFHLLIPAYTPIVMDFPIMFHHNLFPLQITGEKHRNVEFVWLCIQGERQGMDLRHIGELEIPENPVSEAGAFSFYTCIAGCMASGVASIIFPPAITAFIPFWSGGMASWAVSAGGEIYDASNRERAFVLGDPIFLNSHI